MRLVSIEMLTDDMELALPVYRKSALVINAGRKGISRYIPNLTNMGIQYVYVEDELSRGIKIPDVISTQTRFDCKNALRSTMQNYIEKGNFQTLELTDSLESVIEDILKNKDVQVSLNEIGIVDEYTYQHSVNVAVYSLLIGRALNYGASKMKDLAMGALLHDVGKTILEPEIQFKKGRLTDAEYTHMKKHVDIGYYILQKNPALSPEAREIALTHHERLDGSGYPKGLVKEEISEFSQITAIADVYDALTSDRCYKQKWATHRAVDFLIKNAVTEFSPELVQLFIQQIAIYPNGSMVAMSDGCVGIVKEQNPKVPLRPIIRIIFDKNGQAVEPYEINLLKVLSLTIVKAELEIVESWKADSELQEFLI